MLVPIVSPLTEICYIIIAMAKGMNKNRPIVLKGAKPQKMKAREESAGDENTGGADMENTSVIFWFSGTGNSLYAAKQLAAGLGDISLVQITGGAPPSAVGGEGEKVGFVVPSYFCNMPRAASVFIEKLEIRPGTYIFGIVTMGAMGQGTVDAISRAVKAKGLELDYGRGVLMPANYVLKYNPADPEKAKAKLDKAEESLRAFAEDIKAGKKLYKGFPFNGKNLYKNIEALDKGFSAGGACTGCGICEKVCPVGNILMEGGKPKWQGGCEHCVACISWCPEKVIDFEGRTQSRRRYRHPKITVEDLLKQG